MDIGRFVERRAQLMRWGWGTANAEALAERLVCRDRAGDTRASCVECAYYRAPVHLCGNSGRAGLRTAQVARDLAGLLQRCPGFLAASIRPAEASTRPATAVDGAGRYPREGSS